ncbi:MAG: tetratricopeptide repeat protein [Symploca sp. SIO1B1]|nr:tetratricopeptide repeat protein [Symploca sp. SIO1B1]
MLSQFPIPHSPFPIPNSPFPIPHSPFPILRASLLVGIAITTQLVSQLTASASPYPFAPPAEVNITSRLEQEVSFYQKRIRQSPQDGLNQALLATAYLKLARTTGDSNWYLLAEQAAQQSLKNLPFNNIEALLAQAKVAEAKHDFDGAIEFAQKVLHTHPQHEDALSILVSTYLGKGQIAQAEVAAQQLVDRVPTLSAYTLRALVNVAQGRDEAAIEDFHHALALEEPEEVSHSVWTRTLLARFYASRGELNQGKQLYEEALRILPRSHFVLTQLAQLETRLGNYDRAEKLYSQVVVSPNAWDHVALEGMAQVEVLRGDQLAAEALWEKAEALFRQHENIGHHHHHHHEGMSAFAHHHHHHEDLNTFGHRRELAQLLLSRGREEDLPEVLTLMETDLQMRRDTETLDTYAWVLTRLNRWEDAQAILAEAIATGQRSAVIFYRAGLVEQHLSNSNQAETYFQQAKATDPTFNSGDQQLWGITVY